MGSQEDWECPQLSLTAGTRQACARGWRGQLLPVEPGEEPEAGLDVPHLTLVTFLACWWSDQQRDSWAAVSR